MRLHILRKDCAIACGTRAHAARIFADVAQGKWRPRSTKSFMLLAHNSTRFFTDRKQHKARELDMITRDLECQP